MIEGNGGVEGPVEARAAPWPARGLLAAAVAGSCLRLGMETDFSGRADPIRLAQPVGSIQPRDYLQVFFSCSPACVRLLLFAALVGAVLLLFRRTATAGALLLASFAANGVVLDLCFDSGGAWPAAVILGLALGVLAADRRRLLALWMGSRAIGGMAPTPSTRPAQAGVGVALAVLAGSGIVALRGDFRKPSALAGIYRIEEFGPDGAGQGGAEAAARVWRLVAFDRRGSRVLIRRCDDALLFYRVARTDGGILSLERDGPDRPGSAARAEMSYTLSGPDLLLECEWDGQPISARARRETPSPPTKVAGPRLAPG